MGVEVGVGVKIGGGGVNGAGHEQSLGDPVDQAWQIGCSIRHDLHFEVYRCDVVGFKAWLAQFEIVALYMANFLLNGAVTNEAFAKTYEKDQPHKALDGKWEGKECAAPVQQDDGGAVRQKAHYQDCEHPDDRG